MAIDYVRKCIEQIFISFQAQSLVVIFVAFTTFFFHVRNFSDRIMVNLALLLILATINSTTQSVRVSMLATLTLHYMIRNYYLMK